MGEPPPLTGPRLPPAGGAAPGWLVVLLHGVGADGNDLIGLAPVLRRIVPTAAFVAPNAPLRFDMAPSGYMWFSLQDFQPETRWNGVRRAAPALQAFLAHELDRCRLDPRRLVLIGFSQGAMMALHVGLRLAVPPRAIVSHSGMLVGAEHLAAEISGRPPVLLTHGADDEVLPAACLPIAELALAAADVPVEAHMLPNLGHGIDEPTLAIAGRFLARHLAAPDGG